MATDGISGVEWTGRGAQEPTEARAFDSAVDAAREDAALQSAVAAVGAAVIQQGMGLMQQAMGRMQETLSEVRGD
jgi:hypothetical protein